jgi:glycosyltransferase involved in cell wall biosynthesis
LKIAVNTRLLLKNKLEGIGWFTYETLKRITVAHPEHEFIFIFDRAFDDEFIFSDNITPVIANPPSRHPLLWYLFFDWGVPAVLNKHKPDLFLSPDGFLSLRTKVPSIPVIHDLNFEHYPEYLPKINQYYYHYFFHRFAQKATRIATVSEFTKSDINQTYGISKDKIDVVYNGANTLYSPLSESEIQAVRNEYTDGKPYFFFIGLLHPRKNITRLIQAYDVFRKSHPGVKLMIVGEKKWWTDDIRNAFENSPFKEDILLLGRKSPDELKRLIPAALAMVYVPIFEGFGIPIMEAFSCNVPVITSNTTSMPEVGSDAVLLVDPFQVDSIASGMKMLFTDNKLRADMVQKGTLRRADFSWDKTADILWKCVEKTNPGKTGA